MSSFMCLLTKIKTCPLFQAKTCAKDRVYLRAKLSALPSGVAKGKVPENNQLLLNSLPNHTGHSRDFLEVGGTPEAGGRLLRQASRQVGRPVIRLIGTCGPSNSPYHHSCCCNPQDILAVFREP